MGKTDTKIIDSKRAAASKGNTDTETASSETKRGRGRPRKGEPGGGQETTNDIPKLVLVSEPAAGEEEQPEATEAPAAPKNPSKRKRKDLQYEFKKEQISVLLKSTFDIIGSRPGLEMWKLSKQEADMIAEPLSSLMAKNPILDKITSEYGEWIALIMALGTVILPRAFVMWAAKPPKKEKINPYVAITKVDGKPRQEEPTTRRDQAGATRDSHKQSSGQPTAPGSNIGSKLYDLIPAIQ